MLERLNAALHAVCPLEGVYADVDLQQVLRIDYAASATQAQRDAADTAASAFDWSQGAHAAWLVLHRRAAIVDALTDAQNTNASRDRALALTLLDAYTLLAGRVNSLLTAIDGASSLATLKTAVAAINDCPTFTGADLLQLLRNHVNAGEVD